MSAKRLTEAIQLVLRTNLKKCRQKAFPGSSSARRCARAFNVTPAQWSHWETGRRVPDSVSRQKLAAFFNITEHELLNPNFNDNIIKSHNQISSQQFDIPSETEFSAVDAADPLKAFVARVAEHVSPQLASKVAPHLTSTLVAQIAPAIIDRIAEQITPIIVDKVCQQLGVLALKNHASTKQIHSNTRNP